MPALWDPLTYENLMAGTVAYFETQERRSLSDTSAVEGLGIYALYYEGALAEYQSIADGGRPIYAGKAVPRGARKGGDDVDVDYPALRDRLRQHARSVRQVHNLELDEFSYRALSIVPVWIVFAEQALIRKYSPVWNSCLDGFGKHDQGRNRQTTERSWWDTFHPGRPWTEGETETKTAEEARRRLLDFWEHSIGEKARSIQPRTSISVDTVEKR